MVQPGGPMSVLMRLDRDGRHDFLLVLTREGVVKRMGSSARGDHGGQLRTGRLPGAFDELMKSVPAALLQRAGTYEADGSDGPRCEWRIEFDTAGTPKVFRIAYHERSAGLPKAIADVVRRAEELTEEWYERRLSGGSDADVREVDGARNDDHASAGGADGASPSEPAGKAATREPDGYAATNKRILLAVVLDFALLRVPWAWMGTLGSDDTALRVPPGGGLVLFAFVEIVLLQFVRRSPAYWLLGMSAAFGRRPVVDRGQKDRESWATMIAAFLMLTTGVGGLTSWTGYHTPAPYFGLDLSAGPSIAFTVALSFGMVVSGVLIYRTDPRGVIVGAAELALTFVSVAFGHGSWDIWFGQELMNQAAYEGRPVDQGMLEATVGLAEPILFGSMVVQAILLFVCWRALQGTRTSR